MRRILFAEGVFCFLFHLKRNNKLVEMEMVEFEFWLRIAASLCLKQAKKLKLSYAGKSISPAFSSIAFFLPSLLI